MATIANGAVVEFCHLKIWSEFCPNTKSDESVARIATTLSALKSIFMELSAEVLTTCVVSVSGSYVPTAGA